MVIISSNPPGAVHPVFFQKSCLSAASLLRLTIEQRDNRHSQLGQQHLKVFSAYAINFLWTGGNVFQRRKVYSLCALANVVKTSQLFRKVITEICFYKFEILDHFMKPFLRFVGSILRNRTLVRLGQYSLSIEKLFPQKNLKKLPLCIRKRKKERRQEFWKTPSDFG